MGFIRSEDESAMNLQWATEPTEQGKYYWIHRTCKQLNSRSTYIAIMRITNDTEWYIDHGDRSEFPADEIKSTYLYCGPLQEPEPPND